MRPLRWKIHNDNNPTNPNPLSKCTCCSWIGASPIYPLRRRYDDGAMMLKNCYDVPMIRERHSSPFWFVLQLMGLASPGTGPWRAEKDRWKNNQSWSVGHPCVVMRLSRRPLCHDREFQAQKYYGYQELLFRVSSA